MIESILQDKLNYWIFILLMMLGLWAMMSKKNLIKKLMGMSIFQSAVILFYVSTGAKDSSADIPIYPHDLIHPPHHEAAAHGDVYHSDDHGNHKIGGESHNAHHDLSAASDLHTNQHQYDAKAGHEAKSHADDHDTESHHPKIASKVNADDYNNPLPHVLMLTAIVVGVATLGVALSLVQRIYRLYGSIEEDEVIAAIENETANELTIESIKTASTDTTGSHA